MSPLPRAPARSRRATPTTAVIIALSTALLFAGCATSGEVRYGEATPLPAVVLSSGSNAAQALSIGEIIIALRAGQSQRELAQQIASRGLLAPASAADVDLLLEAGAGPELLDVVHAASAALMTNPAVVAPMPAIPPAAVIAPPVYIAPPLFPPGYYGYPVVPWASFGFSYRPPVRPPRGDGPHHPPRRDWAHGHAPQRHGQPQPDARPLRPPSEAAPNQPDRWQSGRPDRWQSDQPDQRQSGRSDRVRARSMPDRPGAPPSFRSGHGGAQR